MAQDPSKPKLTSILGGRRESETPLGVGVKKVQKTDGQPEEVIVTHKAMGIKTRNSAGTEFMFVMKFDRPVPNDEMVRHILDSLWNHTKWLSEAESRQAVEDMKKGFDWPDIETH